MTFLPVVQRELLVASRSAMIRWQRFGAVALGVGVFLVVMLGSQQTPQLVGGQLFYLLAALLWVLAWLSGPLITTDALTREKREGTLGLLLLTELRGYDIVLGKAAASALQQVMLLVGVLPVLALPVAMGGISGGETFRVMVSLLLTQAFSLAVGLMFSTGCRTFWNSLSWTVGTLGVITFLPVGVDLFLRLAGRPSPDFLLGLGPLGLTICGFAKSRQANPAAAVQWSTGAQWILFSSFLAVAWAGGRLRRGFLAAERRPAAGTHELSAHPLTGWRHVHDRERLEANPYYWLKHVVRSEKRPLGRIAWGMIGTSILWAVVLVVFRHGSAAWIQSLIALGLLTAYAATQLVKVGLVMAGVRQLGEDLRSGALELLLTTPLTTSELVTGCRTALAEEFRSLQWGLNAVYGVWAMAVVIAVPEFGWPGVAPGCLMALGAMVLLQMDLGWGIAIALRAGVREADPMKALRKAILRWMAPGWSVAAVLVFPALFGGRINASLLLLICLLLVFLGIAVIRSAARRASLDLEYGLRDIAAGLYFDTNKRELAEAFRSAAMTWEDRWFNRR